MLSLIEQLVEEGKPVSRKKALASLTQTPLIREDALPTLNSIRNIYGLVFETSFWDSVGVATSTLALPDLQFVSVNPMGVMAAQHSVSRKQVIRLLRLPRRQFDTLVHGAHDPTQPIVLVSTPHGYITVNGHHRMRALQALNIRQLRLPAITPTSSRYFDVVDLFFEFGYVDKMTKQVYDRYIGTKSDELRTFLLRLKNEKGFKPSLFPSAG